MFWIFNYDDYEEYRALRNFLIIDSVGQVASIFVYLVIALVIYRSSKIVSHTPEPLIKQNVSLLAYLREQYTVQQKETIQKEHLG